MKKSIALLLVCMSLLSLAACGGGGTGEGSTATNTETGTSTAEATQTAETSTDPVYGGDACIYISELGSDYDPTILSNRNYALWYERLWSIDYSKTGNDYTYITQDDMTGQIAKDWSYDSATKTLTVTIRDDVYFQSKDDAQYDIFKGRKLVATDVKWTFDRILGTGSGFTQPYDETSPLYTALYMVESIETQGDTTILFHFNVDSDIALSDFILANVNISGPEWDTLTADQKADWHYACGTGPYILTEYVQDSYMKFVRNENYYATDARYPENKLPYLDTITLNTFADANNALTQFISGQLDYLGANWNVLDSSQIAQLKASMDASDYQEYDLNSQALSIALKLSSNEPFKDIRVREAMQYAINQQEINEAFYDGAELEVPGMFATSTELSSVDQWDEELKDSYYSYDLDKAKQLMEDAGYADGFEFTVVLRSGMNTNLYQVVADYLAQINITMDIVVANTPMEMQARGYDENDPACINAALGTNFLPMATGTWRTGGMFNSVFANDTTLDSMIDAWSNSATMDEYIANGQALDLYFAQQHYVLNLGAYLPVQLFTSSSIGGYDGVQPFASWNITSVLSHMWKS